MTFGFSFEGKLHLSLSKTTLDEQKMGPKIILVNKFGVKRNKKKIHQKNMAKKIFVVKKVVSKKNVTQKLCVEWYKKKVCPKQFSVKKNFWTKIFFSIKLGGSKILVQKI